MGFIVNLSGKTPPVKSKTDYPISISEAKRHLRVDNDFRDDDAYIQGLIYAATQKAEQFIGKDIALTTNVLQIFDFVGESITLDDANYVETVSVVNDASVALTVVEERKYYNFTYIELSTDTDSDPLTVTYKTGFELGECPELIKHAILVKLADMYDVERSSYTIGAIKEGRAFERLLDSFKIMNVGI